MKQVELFNDHFQNFKKYLNCKAQLIIVDPCAGSGSTIIAVAQCGRKAYGFEIKKDFYKEAKEKVLSTIQQSLF